MIFFPNIYEDELLYSAIARYHNRSANTAIRHTYKEIFNREHITSIIYFPSHIENMIENMPLGCKYTVEEIINKHTLYPFFTSFTDEELSTRIFNLMKGNNCTGISGVIGIQMMSINKPKYLKFCPKCMQDDIKIYGEYYWHRLHQVPGVLVCPKHKIPLENSTVSISYDRPLLVVPSKDNCPQNTITYNEDTIDKLYKLAKDIEQIFNLKIKKRDKLWYRENYTNYIISKNLATLNGVIKSKELIKSFKEYYGDSVLDILESNIEINNYYSWIYKLLKTTESVNPIRHLLLIRFLGIEIEDIFNFKYKYMPFGEPSWPCLNKVCKYYKKNVIEHVSLNYNYKPTTILIGTFECSCGFTYTRQATNLGKQLIYKQSRVKKYGELWENKLIELLKNNNKSLNEIAKELGTTNTTISRYCKKMKLRINDNYENVDNKETRINNKQKTQKKHRDTWVKLLKENPNISRNDLIILARSAYCWLYKFDKEWLDNNMPESKRYKHKIKRNVDWNIRDREVLAEVKLVAQKMLLSSEKPERISISSIASKINNPLILKLNIDKMPKTKSYIYSVKDTTKSFRIKKLKWVIKEMSKNNEKISVTKVAKKISLDQNAINELRDIIKEEIEKVNSM